MVAYDAQPASPLPTLGSGPSLDNDGGFGSLATTTDGIYVPDSFEGLLIHAPCTSTSGAVAAGTVTEAGTGRPIDRVLVRVWDGTATLVAAGATDSNGEYEIDGLPSGEYRLTVEILGYRDELYYNLGCENGCDVLDGTPISVYDGVTSYFNFELDTYNANNRIFTDDFELGNTDAWSVSVPGFGILGSLRIPLPCP